jgi:quercetin dioxygenase-like cupin family protein
MTEPAPVFEDVARVITLASEAPLSAGDIASRTIFKSPFARIVLFRFSEGTELTEHTTPARVIVQILSGRCEFTAGSDQRVLAGGDAVYLPPNQPHSVRAVEAFFMVITMLNDPPARAI